MKPLGAEHSYIEFTVEDYLRGFIEAIHVAEEPLHHLQSVLLYLLFKKGIPEKNKSEDNIKEITNFYDGIWSEEQERDINIGWGYQQRRLHSTIFEF